MAKKLTSNLMMHVCIMSFALLAFSCNRYYYQPNPVNAPMLTEKNDLKILVSANVSDIDFNDNLTAPSEVLNASVAYSPIKHLGIMTSYTNYKYRVGEARPQEGHVDLHKSLFEGGIGGYYPILTQREGFKLVADAYVGYGGGKLDSDVKMNFNRLFFQPGFNFTTPFFDVGVAARVSGIKYSDFNSNGMTAAYINREGLSDVTSKRTYFFEPALTLRGGYKFIKGQFQIVKSDSFKKKAWTHNDNIFTFGVFVSIEEFLKLKKSK